MHTPISQSHGTCGRRGAWSSVQLEPRHHCWHGACACEASAGRFLIALSVIITDSQVIFARAQAVLYKLDAVLLPPSTSSLVPGNGSAAGPRNVTIAQALQSLPVSLSSSSIQSINIRKRYISDCLLSPFVLNTGLQPTVEAGIRSRQPTAGFALAVRTQLMMTAFGNGGMSHTPVTAAAAGMMQPY